jgi:hypothetical protein
MTHVIKVIGENRNNQLYKEVGSWQWAMAHHASFSY